MLALRNKGIIVLLFQVFVWQQTIAKQFHSINSGCWDDANTWVNNEIPSYQDSIFIHHLVWNNRGIYLRNNAYLNIDPSGYLCVFGNVEVPCGCFFWNYGTLYCSEFDLTGDGSSYGFVHAQVHYHVHSCTYPYLHGSIEVGGMPDTCSDSQICYSKLNEEILIYPNPVINDLNIKFLLESKQTIIIDLIDEAGREISELLNSEMTPDLYDLHYTIDHINYTKSFYILRIKIGDRILYRKLIFIP